MGDEEMTRKLIRKGASTVHCKDHLGRNALHFAVCSGNMRVVTMLLKAGVNPNIKDNVGMTPLSLCLMRRPMWKTANLLFQHGAVLLTRMTPMDTGLFIQFVMMCIPTKEEERILRLLVEKGALVNDPEAPGQRQPLHFAAMSNNCTLIRILIDLGADLYAKNHRNETPRQVAATFKCKEAMAIFEALEGEYDRRDSETASNVTAYEHFNLS
ncbi:potassium channel AKT6-like [Trichoplusia ni]|nr:potassium channel AKT6-like [Trichoplusia ni]